MFLILAGFPPDTRASRWSRTTRTFVTDLQSAPAPYGSILTTERLPTPGTGGQRIYFIHRQLNYIISRTKNRTGIEPAFLPSSGRVIPTYTTCSVSSLHCAMTTGNHPENFVFHYLVRSYLTIQILPDSQLDRPPTGSRTQADSFGDCRATVTL